MDEKATQRILNLLKRLADEADANAKRLAEDGISTQAAFERGLRGAFNVAIECIKREVEITSELQK